MNAVTTNFTDDDRWKKPAILVSLGIIALLIRAPGLGKWGFTVDEYYFNNAVGFILEKGIPQFPDGGYYVRGILVQYLTVLSSLVFQKPEFSSRFIALIFGVASVPLFYLVCRLFLPTSSALICACMLLVSSWNIEFSRFARMYAPFQFTFFAFIYFYYSGYFLNNGLHRIFSWIVAFISIFIYEGSIFCPFLLLLPMLLENPPFHRNNLKLVAAVVILLGFNFAFHGVNYRGVGVKNPYPDVVQPSVKSVAPDEEKAPSWIKKLEIDLPFHLPQFDLLKTSIKSTPLAIGYLFCVIAGIICLKNSKYGKSLPELFSVVLAAALPLVHQYGLLFIILVLFFLSKKSVLNVFSANRKYWLPYLSITILYWVFAGIMVRKTLFPMGDRYDKAEAFIITLFDYPKYLESFLEPFYKVMPMLEITFIFLLFVSTLLFLKENGNDRRKFLLWILYICILIVSTIKTQYTETRYSFFFFPLFAILLLGETVHLKDFVAAHSGNGRMKMLSKAILPIPMILFLGMEDFHFKHLADVSSMELNFRLGKYDRYSTLWYPRVDLKTPAEYVNKSFKSGDVVVVGAVTSAFYLEKPFVNYIDSASPRFRIMSRKKGKREIWTGRPLVHNPEDFLDLVPVNPENSLWLIAGIGYCMPDSFGRSDKMNDFTIERGIYPVLRYEGIDRRIGVWELRRLPQ